MKIAHWLLLCVLSFVWACKNDSSSSGLDNGIENNLLSDSSAVSESPDPYFIKKYAGNIGGNLLIEMVLVNWGDGYLSGRYWYQGKKGVLELSGEVKEDNSFEIYESAQGKETGLFAGALTDPLMLTGTWSNPTKTKNLTFELHSLTTEATLPNWNGNWHLNAVWDDGRLLIGNVTKDSFDFAISIVRGSHTGTIEGQAALKGTRAFYKKKEFEDEPCVLEFIHQDSFVHVEQSSSNFACGFGARAYATGKYERKNRRETATLKVGTNDDAVFPTQALHDAFKKMVGDTYYEIFAFNMQAIQSTRDMSGKTVVTGYIPGLFGSNEAIIIFDQQGSFWAATLDYDEVNTETLVRYFTNDPSAKRRMPVDIENWREGFKDLRVVL